MGDVAKKAGGVYSGVMTGGAFNTDGSGWLQGGDVVSGFTGGMAGDRSRGKIGVPGATAQPGWNLTSPDGKLRSDLMLNGEQPKAFGQSADVLGKLQGMATATGPSASASYLMDQNKRNMSNQMDQAGDLGNQQLSAQTNQMAMRGGVDAGARERLGRNIGFDTMMNKQKIANDGAGNNLDILAKDEAQKLQVMQALPSQLLSQAGFEQDGRRFDIGNTLNTIGNKYQADMSMWGANQTAREQAQLANKKTGVLGLGIGGIL